MNEMFYDKLWRLCETAVTQVWESQEPEYPGHDSGGSASVDLGVIALSNAFLVLNRAEGLSEDQDVGVRISDEDEEGVWGDILARVPKEISALEKVLDMHTLEGWDISSRMDQLVFPDRSKELKRLLKSTYKPLEGAELTANHGRK